MVYQSKVIKQKLTRLIEQGANVLACTIINQCRPKKLIYYKINHVVVRIMRFMRIVKQHQHKQAEYLLWFSEKAQNVAEAENPAWEHYSPKVVAESVRSALGPKGMDKMLLTALEMSPSQTTAVLYLTSGNSASSRQK
jgi:hypothetical protein